MKVKFLIRYLSLIKINQFNHLTTNVLLREKNNKNIFLFLFLIKYLTKSYLTIKYNFTPAKQKVRVILKAPFINKLTKHKLQQKFYYMNILINIKCNYKPHLIIFFLNTLKYFNFFETNLLILKNTKLSLFLFKSLRKI